MNNGNIRVEFSDGKTIHVSGMDSEIFSALEVKYKCAIIGIDGEAAAFWGMNHTEIEKELRRIGKSEVEIQKQLMDVRSKCDHLKHMMLFHAEYGYYVFKQSDSNVTICPRCGKEIKID